MDDSAMKVACMQLINAIVSTPDDLDFRLHLRNEFMRTGLIDALEVRTQDLQSVHKPNTSILVATVAVPYLGLADKYFRGH